MILIIDNYDSFTYNLAHLVAALDDDVKVFRNDAISADEAIAFDADAIVLSPGPSTPDNAGICLELIARAAALSKPVFGVCLGLQSIAQAFGGRVIRANKLMHGKTSEITHQGEGLFRDLPNDFTATRYHSLIADPATLPSTLKVTARSADDQEIMAVAHRSKPIAGVQFHPESIASEHGEALIKNFLDTARAKQAGRKELTA
ncbi:MAG: aminodeoxychorismate/anthranilate synthase component II [Pseudomonadota bacterium]